MRTTIVTTGRRVLSNEPSHFERIALEHLRDNRPGIMDILLMDTDFGDPKEGGTDED